MPGWLQPVAEWNPMSALAAACRHLFGNPNPAAAVHAWPMQHPELAVVCWAVAMLVVFAPLAVHLYRRKALGWASGPAALDPGRGMRNHRMYDGAIT